MIGTEIPMKPNEYDDNDGFVEGSGYIYRVNYACPKCGARVIPSHDKCPKCDLKLDWSDI